jgi:DNA (cytosine-5)-methyltransferase 1
MVTVGGQCEGYGGIFEALRMLLPAEHAWLAEIDADASAVLAHRYPAAKNLGDITAVDWPSAERVDILSSGFPCQPASSTGPKLGAADPRYLWPTGVRPAIAALRPSLVVVENVRGLLSIDRGALFGGILADLDAFGYTVAWSTIGACLVGACHHRHRVFLTATPRNVPVPMADAPLARLGENGWETPPPASGRRARRPIHPRWPQAGLMGYGHAWDGPVYPCGSRAVPLLPTITASDRFGAGGITREGGMSLRTAVAVPGLLGDFADVIDGHGRAYGLPVPPATEPGRNGQPRLTAAFGEFLQGLAPGWLADVVGRRAAIRLAGNGVNPRQCVRALSLSPVFESWARGKMPPWMIHGGV